METKSVANLVANQAIYSVPADFNILRSLSYKGTRLKSFTFNEFNEYIDGFNATSDVVQFGPGTPVCYMVWNNEITLFPTPAEAATGGLFIYYLRHPTSVASTADNLSLPLQYHNAIVQYCLQQAYELDEDSAKSANKEAQFNRQLQQLNDRNKWTAQEYYPGVTVLPEDSAFGDMYPGGY
jgi:hypothetical protein